MVHRNVSRSEDHHRRPINRWSSCLCRYERLNTRLCLEVGISMMLILGQYRGGPSPVVATPVAARPSQQPDCSTSPFEVFDDVVSRTYLSRFVIVGQLKRRMEDPAPTTAVDGHGRQRHRDRQWPTSWTGEFLVKTILKNDDNEHARGSFQSVSVGSRIVVTTAFSSSSSSSDCVDGSSATSASWVDLPVVGSPYVVFVGESSSNGDVDGDGDASRPRRFACLGQPERFSKNAAKLVRSNSCADCGELPRCAEFIPNERVWVSF